MFLVGILIVSRAWNISMENQLYIAWGSVLTDGTSRYAGILKLTIKPEGLEQMEIVPAIQTEEKTEYLDDQRRAEKMYDAVAASLSECSDTMKWM